MNMIKSMAASIRRPKVARVRRGGLKLGLIRGDRVVARLTLLLCAACLAIPLYASYLHPLEIAMVESRGLSYFEPAGRRIVIQSQPLRLFVRIKNTSDSAVLIRVHPEKAYSIELKDHTGVILLVKRKKTPGGDTDDDTRVNLSPGAERIIPIQISRDAWDGLPVVESGKQTQYTARLVYETADGQHLYSEPYTLIFDIR